jgi:phosphoglycerol transferase
MDSAALRENFAIDFRDSALYPPYVISVTGLSRAEKWGRWSDGKSVSVRFASCLPDGPIEVLLTANAFGPNVESPILVRVGENAARFRLSAHTADVSVVVPHDSSCQTLLTFDVPNPASPEALGQSRDPRLLGIGFTQLRVTPAAAHDVQTPR